MMQMGDYYKVAVNRVPPRTITCPNCLARFYSTREYTRKYFDEGLYDVHCSCGCWYQVINRDKICIIRRKSV